MVKSVLSLITPPGVIRKSHAWFWNSGDNLPSFWSTQNHSGTNTYAMSDEVNGGMRITTGITSGNNGSILQGEINHFSHIGSIYHTTAKRAGASTYVETGLMEKKANPPDTSIFWDNDSADSFHRLRTGLNNTLTSVNTAVAADANYHRVILQLRASSGLMSIDGSLDAVSTSNLPDLALQLFFRVGSKSAGAKTGRWRYAEAYNT